MREILQRSWLRSCIDLSVKTPTSHCRKRRCFICLLSLPGPADATIASIVSNGRCRDANESFPVALSNKLMPRYCCCLCASRAFSLRERSFRMSRLTTWEGSRISAARQSQLTPGYPARELDDAGSRPHDAAFIGNSGSLDGGVALARVRILRYRMPALRDGRIATSAFMVPQTTSSWARGPRPATGQKARQKQPGRPEYGCMCVMGSRCR